MAVPEPHVLAAGAGGLLFLLFAVGGFVVVIVVAAVILALIQAVLPGPDTEAERVRAAELAGEGAGEEHPDEEPADLRSRPPVG